MKRVVWLMPVGLILAAVFAAPWADRAHAQNYPAKAIKRFMPATGCWETV